jgi:hypothetical protein
MVLNSIFVNVVDSDGGGPGEHLNNGSWTGGLGLFDRKACLKKISTRKSFNNIFFTI